MSGEMSRTFQTFAEVGFYRSATWHGLVAQYGGFLGALALDRKEMSRMFAAQARQTIGGDFAAQLQAEKDAGYPTRAVIEAVTKAADPLSQAEARVRRALTSELNEELFHSLTLPPATTHGPPFSTHGRIFSFRIPTATLLLPRL